MLSRIMPCPDCGHESHFLRCEALIDAVVNVLCPCRGVPVPGVYLEGATPDAVSGGRTTGRDRTPA